MKSNKKAVRKQTVRKKHVRLSFVAGGSGWKIIKRNTSFVLAFFFIAKFAANSHHCKSFMAGNYQETNCTQEFMANFFKILFFKALLPRKIGLKEILSETEYENNRIRYCNIKTCTGRKS